MNKFYITILTILTCIFSGLAQEEYQTHTINVGEFTTLKVCDHINVVYSTKPDSIGFAHFNAPVSMVNSVMFENNNGTLVIRIETDYKNVCNLPVVYVYSRFLKEVRNEADGILRVLDCAPSSELKFETLANGKLLVEGIDATKVNGNISTGKGLISLTGKAKHANLKLFGTGEIQADELVSGDVSCKILGTGTIGCNVNGELNVKGSGTGKIYYTGNPTKIKKTTLGPVKVIPLNGEPEAEETKK